LAMRCTSRARSSVHELANVRENAVQVQLTPVVPGADMPLAVEQRKARAVHDFIAVLGIPAMSVRALVGLLGRERLHPQVKPFDNKGHQLLLGSCQKAPSVRVSLVALGVLAKHWRCIPRGVGREGEQLYLDA